MFPSNALAYCYIIIFSVSFCVNIKEPPTHVDKSYSALMIMVLLSSDGGHALVEDADVLERHVVHTAVWSHLVDCHVVVAINLSVTVAILK